MKDVELRGPRLRVRRVRETDAEVSYAWFADPRVTEFLPLAGERSLPLGEIRSFLQQASRDDDPAFTASIELHDGRLIGCGGLRLIVPRETAEISVVIGEPELWGSGYGREAMQLLMGFGFEQLELASLWLIVRGENARGLQLFESLGFAVEETLFGAAIVRGVARDKLRMRRRAPQAAGLACSSTK
jgi:RimJ/RimL family protein N-acetyltransferase